MIVRNILTILLWMFFLSVAHAAAPFVQWSKANDAYQAGDFEKAIQQYEALLKQGYRSEALYYNLGNCYYKKNNVGRAILHYERALLIDPNDRDTRHNLEIVRNQLQDKIEPLPTFFLAQWWMGLYSQLSASAWSILAIILLWLGLACGGLWLLGKIERNKKWGFIGGIGLLVLSLLSFTLASARHQAINNTGRAVVLQSEILLHSAPDDKSRVILSLHEGTTIRFLDKIAEWHKVALENGEQGWIFSKGFERI